jgi:hypothetical protein
MVYLREVLRHNRDRLTQHKNIELAAYLFVASPERLTDSEFELSPDEEIALKGYKRDQIDKSRVTSIIAKPAVKGMSATSNIFKFAGLYLAAPTDLFDKLKEKYIQSDLRQRYFLSKIEPAFESQIREDIKSKNNDPDSIILGKILGSVVVTEDQLDEALKSLTANEPDVQTQILLEDLESVLLKTRYVNKSSEDIIRDILNNFPNAIQKIIANRRSGHPVFKIEDEYDVQDILYVVLKSIFPNLRDEDPIPKVGGKSTKIDLILRGEEILIEVKMIKKTDSNEVHFIEQLKVDFESYHECKWLKKLFCFVYDPYRKTRDISNFGDLNGDRTKNNHSFNVELILVN